MEPQQQPTSLLQSVDAAVSSPIPIPSASAGAAQVEPSNDARPISTGHGRGKKWRNPPSRSDTPPAGPASASTTNFGRKPKSTSANHRRGAKFGADLTDPSPSASQLLSSSRNRSKRPTADAPEKNDITSNLIQSFSAPPYPDCLICLNAVHPAQPTWSCSPSSEDGDLEVDMQCCWVTFHLKCIRSWALKSVKEVSDAWRARGEERSGEWRCPGCQFKRAFVPSGYRCFCGSTLEPKLSRLAIPHSCANLCSRHTTCGHPCPLLCHPGPCPPCQITIHKPCYCGSRSLPFKCSNVAKEKIDISCGQMCGKMLECRNHTCANLCHEGPCEPCKVTNEVRCYCRKAKKQLDCGEGLKLSCEIVGEGAWVGEFSCADICGRPFDCGVHFCSKLCHPPSSRPPPCPRSPSLVTHCGCGKHALDSAPSSPFFPPGTQLRTHCTDLIPNCVSTCLKPLAGCSHVCSGPCHAGPCPPCAIRVVRPCRCGATKRDVPCANLQAATKEGGVEEVLCDRPCQALRTCRRHQCNRLCCPLASIKPPKGGPGKKRFEAPPIDDGVLHECDLPCGRMLSCGNHRCEENDHRGACPPCLRSSFEELVCYCGLTVLDPPIPCGTRIDCHHQCSREPPACGHPSTQHACHDDSTPCPPCPFLTSKFCACGKKTIANIKCSQERVFCGTTCGKLLPCGFHRCERSCHGDECGPCTLPCGKPRKSCLPLQHPCTLPCHAPSVCLETEPCQASIGFSCPCGRRQRSEPCGRTAESHRTEHSDVDTSPPKPPQIQCTIECQIAKRNAMLADALGIQPEAREKAARGAAATYREELQEFARKDLKFLALVETAFAQFVTSDKKVQILPRTNVDKRRFVQSLAAVYRMDVQILDQEPNRSVQLVRRIDTRIPAPLLSEVLSPGRAAVLATPRQPASSDRDRAWGVTGSPADKRTDQAGVPSNAWTAVPSFSAVVSSRTR